MHRLVETMPHPGTPQRKIRQATRTIRNQLHHAYPWVAPANATYEAADFIELAALATARNQSLSMASQTHVTLPDSDTLHHHLHNVPPTQVYDCFQETLDILLAIAGSLGWLREPVLVAIDRHNEPVYGAEQLYMCGMERKAGTNRAHAYLTCQRLTDPRLTLALQLLNPLRTQHDALQALLARTIARQAVLAFLLDKAFHNQFDLKLLLATGRWFVVPTPIDRSVPKAADELYRVRQRVGLGRHIATRSHRLGDPKTGADIVQVFVWEPDPEKPGEELLFVYACPELRSLAELDEWAQTYRVRWGIETGYRQLEAARIRTTSDVYANRLWLTLIALLLDTAWRLQRHARKQRGERHDFTMPQFLLQLEPANADPITA